MKKVLLFLISLNSYVTVNILMVIGKLSLKHLVLVTVKHRANIVRIMNGTEPKAFAPKN